MKERPLFFKPIELEIEYLPLSQERNIKNMKKILALSMIMLLAFSALAACAKDDSTNESTEALRVAALAGPTGMGLAYLMEDKSDDYAVQVLTAPVQINSKFISDEVDIAAVPINLAASLYQATEGDAVIIAVNTLGVLYVLENGDSINELSDLAGEKLYCTGQGSTPEYTISYILEQNGLSDSVEIEFLAEHIALSAELISKTVDIGMLPEPHVSSVRTQNPDATIAIDINEEWKSLTGTDLIQGCFIVRREYLEQNPNRVAQFIEDAKASSEKLLSEEDAAAIVVKQGIVASEEVARLAIPNSNIVCITGEEMKEAVQKMFEILFDYNAESIGGSLPNEDIYYLGN